MSTQVVKMPAGRPPNMKNPEKLLAYLRQKATLIDHVNPALVKVPGLEGHPVDGVVEYPGLWTDKNIAYFNSGRTTGYDASDMYAKPVIAAAPKKILTDTEVIEQITGRFNTLQKISHSACEGKVRSVIVSGKGGVGKTYSVTRIIDHHKEKLGIKAEVHSGMISPLHLYMLLYRNKGKGQIVVLDDADAIFGDEDSLTLLKAALDTTPIRKISWLTNSTTLKNEGIENEFVYEGSMIFITNLNFRAKVASGKGAMVDHLQALMTRAMYLDLKLHSQRELVLWIKHLIKKNHILVAAEDLSMEQETEVLDFMIEMQNQFDSLSIRSAILLAQCVKMDPDNWKDLAMDLCMKDS